MLQVFARKRHPVWTALVSVVLVATGLLLVALAPGATALGLVLYGAGNGLRAIVRGLLPLALMSPADYVRLMGRMSRPSLIGQALTPLAGGVLLQALGAGGVLATLCSLALLNVLLVGWLTRLVSRAPQRPS
ncbi:putative MFS-type transporter [Pseudomonas chlororaphis]|nr:putative MFS-type transporter [Pseudomonas chlororaphis]